MTKDQILQQLETRADGFISGEEIASVLKISRAAVWKGIRQLKAEGYLIDSVTNRGYRLSSASNVLTDEGVKRYLKNQRLAIRTYPSVESTNTLLKKEAQSGAAEGTVIIAAEQTAGRGRMGRSFYSPSGSGVYMSLLLRPTFSAEQSLKLTACAAVAAAQAIEELSGRNTEIKWVNDILLDGKKVCGILTEAGLNCETGGLDYAIVGIGINLCQPREGFPDAISEVAGAVFQGSCPGEISCRMAAAIADRFFELYEDLTSDAIYRDYCRKSSVLGKNVNLIPFGGDPEPGRVMEIDRDYALMVEMSDGTIRKINSGEVSLRLQ